jgi:hypothetical protein
LLGLARQAGERFPDDDGQSPPVDEQSPVVAQADEEPAAWEQWADQEAPAEGQTAPIAYDQQADSGADAPASQLTDNDETLTLDTSQQLDPSAPPEVEPRSARLSPEQPLGDRDQSDDADSAAVIPPMSEAANRPRRT